MNKEEEKQVILFMERIVKILEIMDLNVKILTKKLLLLENKLK
jgi:hypothetical protein